MLDEDVEVDDYEADESENDDNESSSVAVQTEVTFGLGLDIATPQELHTYQETIKELQSELDKVKKDNYTDLKKEMVIGHVMRESDLVDNDKKVLYYTGLS